MHYYKKLQMGTIEKFKTTPKIKSLDPERKYNNFKMKVQRKYILKTKVQRCCFTTKVHFKNESTTMLFSRLVVKLCSVRLLLIKEIKDQRVLQERSG
jgi:hypothetical protein